MRKYAAWLTDEQFRALPLRERALLVSAYFADHEKVRESGRNAGDWVESFQLYAKCRKGDPWCAAFASYCVGVAGGSIPRYPGAVRNWVSFLSITKNPQRGDLFFWLNADMTGHMGFVVRKVGPIIQTIEGNTSSGDNGSQRDGDGVYRRIRVVTPKIKFLSVV